MKLFVGLGNPGKKFVKTRHNVGHLFISNIKNEKLKIKNQIKLHKTTAFMNDSGSEVLSLITNYELPITDLLIVHDDMDLPLGEFKLQRGRGAAGHKGVQSVIDALGTRDFWRLRFGIDRPRGGESAGEDYVLSEFSSEELDRLRDAFKEAYPCALEWAR